jgi:FtsH-binding integral membrane protein
MQNLQNDLPVAPSAASPSISTPVGNAANRVLRNTYMLLGLTMVPTVLGAVLGQAVNFNLLPGSPFLSVLLFLAIAFGFMYGIERTKNSAWGVLLLLAFTFFMGLMLSGLIGRTLKLPNGGQLIALAAGGTGIIFFGMATLAATIKRDLTNMGKFLFVGVLLLIVASLANMFFQIPALALTLMVLAIGIITGGETNYISATLAIYLDIYNIFANLLSLLGITSQD